MIAIQLHPVHVPRTSHISHSRNSSVARIPCRYTSLPERMGEQNPPPAGTPTQGADASVSRRHMSYIHQSDNEDVIKRHRQSDEAEQQRVMGMLHEIEAAALATNKEAGRPELHRGADSVDYLDVVPGEAGERSS